MRKTTKKNKVISARVGIIILLLLLIASIGWVYRSDWTTAQLKFQVAETGSVKHEVQVAVVFANEEILLKASSTGKIKFNGENGQRFRKGDLVAQISIDGAAPGSSAGSSAVKVFAPASGLFYKETDGLENLYEPKALLNMDITKLLAEKENSQKANSEVSTGATIGKIVNNHLPTIAFVELPSLEGLSIGQSLKFRIDQQEYTAKILKKYQNPVGVAVEFNQFVNSSLNKRRQQITWSSRPPTYGTIIPKSALWTKGEEQGVLAVSEGVIRFKKIKIADESETEISSQDLVSGITIVTNPRPGLEGLIPVLKN
ncbi:MAG: HlyD family efflux transporter periplasmic adaptor subunit [Desulfitobacterium hafniense]|nr:HlyD family efflux transporter periplasmic adaptor subunit [Desulfitobacterium hafniense]